MKDAPEWSWWMILPLAAILAVAIGARAWFLQQCADRGAASAALQVQGPLPASDRALVANVTEHQWLGGPAPLSSEEETTAHSAPAMPWLLGALAWGSTAPETLFRWLNCVLGGLTACCYFFFARRAFHSMLVGTIAGYAAALYPFWIINTAELNDGALAGFLLSVCLMLGARVVQMGGALSALLFGLSLAALTMTRAAFLPFALLALLWLLWECRRHSMGWVAGIMALVGFINGVVPWGLRNFQHFERPTPIATSTYLHLWMGNNPKATGSTLDEDALRKSLGKERTNELLEEPNQAKRYHLLADDVWTEVRDHPAETLGRRIDATLMFLLGERWFSPARELAQPIAESDGAAPCPEWVRDDAEWILRGTLIAVFFLAFLGWRWSAAWRGGRIGAVAVIGVALPYVLSHAEHLHGPRLPLDGVLLSYAAFALVSLIPGLVTTPTEETS